MMNRNIRYYLLFLAVLFIQPACTKYLDVQPGDKFLDDQVYSSAVNIQNALNGVYLSMAAPELYGENLSCTAVDVLAQYYNCPFGNSFYNLSFYGYGQSDLQARFTTIWNAAYAATLNLNLFVQRVPGVPESVLDTAAKNLLLGEALGLRAFIVFDMLRMFGPVYILDSTSLAIPYPVAPTSTTVPLLPSNQVISKVLADLQRARELLTNDPVRTKGVVNVGASLNSFYLERNRRMNYFAVTALMARVQLYAGNKPAALASAEAVIGEASPRFPWTDPTTFSTNIGGNVDRCFSSEVLFGLDDINLYTTYRNWFTMSTDVDRSLLIPLYDNQSGTNRLLDIYENQLNDYRYSWWWGVTAGSAVGTRTFIKYKDPGPGAPQRSLLPLMRMSEQYLIAAECTPDPDSASWYLNQVQYYRGLHNLPAGYNLPTELTKAYQKEFWGEGQLFYYYKRTYTRNVANGSYPYYWFFMGPTQYKVPLPLSETQFR